MYTAWIFSVTTSLCARHFVGACEVDVVLSEIFCYLLIGYHLYVEDGVTIERNLLPQPEFLYFVVL